MSGPKVVRVITREELIASGETLLRRLDAALAEWEKTGALTGVTPAEQKASQDRRNALEKMLRADRFAEFGKAAVREIDFLDVDAGRRREKAAQARAQERVRLHSGKELARVLLRKAELDVAGHRDLQRAASGELGLKELDAVLARARMSLFQSGSPKLGVNQQAIAARLASAEKSEDFELWRQRHMPTSPRLEALLGHVSELELLGESGRAVELHQEVLAAVAIAEGAVREMRFDSLVISLKQAKVDAIALAKLRLHASLLAAELRRHQDIGEAAQALDAGAQGTPSALRTAVDAAELRLGELQTAQVAEARRAAVLAGLHQLGYQVHEELSTATGMGGRLVLHNPATAGYGVEIAAGAGMEKLQVRTVSLKANRDTSGDIPAEQRWCDDFGALKGILKAKGAAVEVVNALGVGAVPVKLLSASTAHEERHAASAPLKVAQK